MAYRPIYESAYGFESLDTLHNFFPELLYDDELFPNEMLRFMRMRMNSLFTPTFAREMHSYQIYAAPDRRAAANQWMNLRPVVTTINLAAPPEQAVRETPIVGAVAPLTRAPDPIVSPARTAHPPPATVAPPPVSESAPVVVPVAPVTPIAPTRAAAGSYAHVARRAVEPNPLLTPISVRSSTAVTPEAPRRGVTARTRILGAAGALQVNPMEELLNSLINPNHNLNNIYTTNAIPNISLFDILGGGAGGLNFTDVPVIPTNEEVESGSEIVEHIDVPVETKCSVCQDHEPAAPTTWRKLHCSHYFHKTCIDPWFERDVHCPVCRADIREAEAEDDENIPPPPRNFTARGGAGASSSSSEN